MKIGLLPLYVKLYDDKLPELRTRMDTFYNAIAKSFEQRGIEVVRSPFCRQAKEFSSSVALFEQNNVDAIVTIHIAYSPSLESIAALSKTKLPIIILDTTETLEFTNKQNPEEIMYCHGIHGVMDMCSMLSRKGKQYAISAGYFGEEKCIDKACGYIRSAIAAKALKGSTVGLIGGAFEGMGDFQLPFSRLKNRFGIKVKEKSQKDMNGYLASITPSQIEEEKKENAGKYILDSSIIEEEYTKSVRCCLAMRKCIEKEGLDAFSVNFTKMNKNFGLNSMPFLEACKAMERGIGYAGEGDVLTAAFTGALIKGYPKASFVEIFCPDWKNDMVFLSHMGEVNYRIAAEKPCIKRAATNYSPGEFPYAGYTRMMGGKGVYLNICVTANDFKLVLARGEMVDYKDDNFEGSMRGWMKTECSTAQFLEQLSINGATHHSVFVYDANIEELKYFGSLLGIETVVIG